MSTVLFRCPYCGSTELHPEGRKLPEMCGQCRFDQETGKVRQIPDEERATAGKPAKGEGPVVADPPLPVLKRKREPNQPVPEGFIRPGPAAETVPMAVDQTAAVPFADPEPIEFPVADPERSPRRRGNPFRQPKPFDSAPSTFRPPRASGSGTSCVAVLMILAGILLTGAGSLATAFFLLAYDTSIDGGFGGGRVHNIGLQQTRTLGVQAGLVAIGVGVVLFAAGMVVYSLAKMGRQRW